MKKTVTILGSKYDVYLDVPEDKDNDLVGRFGYCSPTNKKIVTVDLNTVEGWKGSSFYSKEVQKRTTLRHEIIHAFLYESGIWGNSLGTESGAMNEEMIDWLAHQFPKISKVFKKLECDGEI